MKSVLMFTFAVVLFAGTTSLLHAGTLEGKVFFKGKKPAPAILDMSADRRCERFHEGKPVYSDQVVINENGTLRNVFVYIKTGVPEKNYPAPKEHVRLDQAGCQFKPRVLGVMVNQPIDIVNEDETMHNVHALPKNSDQFNIGQPRKGLKRTKSFSKSEVMVKIRCDVHNWMAAYVGVMAHPYFAVTDSAGAFTIPDLPAGEYEIEAWHEKYGTKTMKVSVGASGVKTADFTYKVD